MVEKVCTLKKNASVNEPGAAPVMQSRPARYTHAKIALMPT